MKILLSQPNLNKEDLLGIKKVYDKKWLLNGPVVKKFEEKFKNKFKYKYSTSVSSCTAGLQLVLSSLNLKKGDEVILTSFNFIAAGLSVLQCGLKPIFVDLRKDHFDIDIEIVKKKITKKTKVIILTHFNGYLQPTSNLLKAITKYKNIKVIEDASHVLGSHYKNKYPGSQTFAAVYSFGPTKMITAAGMGGMVVSRNKDLVNKVNILKCYGMDRSSFHRSKSKKPWIYKIKNLGNNFRMTEMQASVGIEQLKKIERFISKRKALINAYKKNIKTKNITYQKSEFTTKPALIYFAIILENRRMRDRLANFLLNKKIGTSVHWDPPLSDQNLFKNFKNNELRNSKSLSSKILSLPLHTKMSFKDVKYIAKHINYFFNKFLH